MSVERGSGPGPSATEEAPSTTARALGSALAGLAWPRRVAARLADRLAAGRGDRRLSPALQGGGAHGAFTWGVLDRLVEDERLAIDALSGASAGAMNAVVLAAGWLDGGRDGARAALAAFWRRIADVAALSPLNPTLIDRLCGPFTADVSSAGQMALGVISRLFSPYQFNPLQLNPLRTILSESIDFERLRRETGAGPELLIAATGLRDGRCRVFRRREVSVEVVLASACLPNLHHAVEIDGEPYWDGGFSSNPPLLALAERDGGALDILLVQINPAGTDELPVTASGIGARLNELVFNGPLRAELDALALAARLARGGFRIGGGAPGRRLARLRLHRIDGAETLRPLGEASKAHPDWRTLTYLRDRGREAAERWLAGHFEALGRRPTFDPAPARPIAAAPAPAGGARLEGAAGPTADGTGASADAA